MLEVSRRVVVGALARFLASEAPIARAADRLRPRFITTFNRAVEAAQDAIPMQELENALSVGHPGTGAPLHILEDALQAFEEALLGNVDSDPRFRSAETPSGLPGAMLDTVAAGAKAVDLCVLPTGNEPILKAKKITATQSQIKEIWDLSKAGQSASSVAAKTGFTVEQVKWVNFKIKNQIPQLMKVLGPYAPPKIPKVPKTPKTTPFVAKTPPATPTPTAISSRPGWPIGDDVVRRMGTQYPGQVRNAYDLWRRNLTYDEQRALESYSGSGYTSMNGYLRQKPGYERVDETVQQKLFRMHSAMDKAKAAHTPPPPELVWRGSSSTGAREFASKLASGDVIQLNGFQSTSIDPNFAKSWGGGGVIFEIKPTAGAYIQPISTHPSEYEFLLPHAKQYRVVGTARVDFGYKGGQQTVVQLEMLP